MNAVMSRDPYSVAKAYLMANGGYPKSALVSSTTNFVANDFENSPEYEEITYWEDHSGILQGVIMTQSNTLKNVSDDRIAIARPGESFTCGQIVNWKDSQWLIYEVNKFNIITDVANLKRCKYLLKFFDTYYRYAETPCALSRTLLKENDTRYQDVGSDEVWLYVQSNEYTDNMPKGGRLIIGRNVYTLESMNFIEYDNVIQIRLSQNDIVNREDNLALGIAGYESNIGHYALSSSIEKTSIKVGDSIVLDTIVLLDGVKTEYPVVYASNNPEIATIDSKGKIVAHTTGDTIITSTFLGLTTDTHISVVENVEDSLSVRFTSTSKNKIYANCSEVISANVYVNGVMSDEFLVDWSVVSGREFASIDAIGNTCTVLAGEVTNQYITIRASVRNSADIYSDFKIKIVGLLG